MAITPLIKSVRAPFANHPGRAVLDIAVSGAAGTSMLSLNSLYSNLDASGPLNALGYGRTKRIDGFQLSPGLQISNPIFRKGPVTGAAAVSSGGVVRITLANHQLVTGECVTIRQVQGCTEANVVKNPITVISTSTFDLNGVTFANAFTTSAASIVEVERPDTTRTITGWNTTTQRITTSANHGYAVGDTVIISGVTGMTFSADVLGVPVRITTVPTAATFIIEPVAAGTFGGTTPTCCRVRSFNSLALLRPVVPAIYSISGAAGGPVVVVTTEANGFSAGQLVSITGVTTSTGVNGTKRVVSLTSGTQFVIEELDGTATTLGGSYGGGGYVTGLADTPASWEAVESMVILLGNSEGTLFRGPFNR